MSILTQLGQGDKYFEREMLRVVDFCSKYKIPYTDIEFQGKNRIIRAPNGSIVNLCCYRGSKLPEGVVFSDMPDGTFICSYSFLESMEGFPKQVGQLDISYSGALKSIEGAPELIRRDFVAIGSGLSDKQIIDFNKQCCVKGRVVYEYEIANLQRSEYNGVVNVTSPRSPLPNVDNGRLIIPYGTTEIKKREFISRLEIEHVSIPDTVESIGDWAFLGCANLKSVYIPDSVKKIGDWVFFGCTNLEDVRMTDAVNKSKSNAFVDVPTKKSDNSVDYK